MLYPVQPRPSAVPTGRAAEPPVKQPFGQSVLGCDRRQTKEMETLEPDSIRHNLSPTRPTLRGVATYRFLIPFSGCKKKFLSCQLLDRLVVLRLAQLVSQPLNTKGRVLLERHAALSLCLRRTIITSSHSGKHLFMPSDVLTAFTVELRYFQMT